MKKYWKSNIQNNFVHFVNIIFLIFLISACDDEPSNFGIDLIPDQDKLPAYYIDTVTIELSQYFMPTTYYTTGNNPILGVADDPYFGRIWAGVGTDLLFYEGYDSAYFGQYKIIDSVRIALIFDSIFYFNSVNPFDHNLLLKVYCMTSPIYRDSFYTTTINPNKFLTGTNLLSSKEINILWKQISFKMPESTHAYFQKYLNLDSNKIILESARYQEGLFGLFFYPVHQSGRDILARLRTDNVENCYLRLYYHLENTQIADSLTAYFISYYYDSTQNVKYGNAGLGFMTYDYTKAKLKTRLNGGTNDSLIYMLGENNLRAKIDFKNLMTLTDIGKYNVLKSELLIPYESSFYSSTSIIQTKTNLIKSVELMVALQPDSFVTYQSQFSAPLYTGYIDTINKIYVIDVTSYIYRRLNNKTSINELYLFPYYRYNINTTMLKNKLKLKIKYIKY